MAAWQHLNAFFARFQQLGQARQQALNQLMNPPQPPKCSRELQDLNSTRNAFNNLQSALVQKQSIYDSCSPGTAAARRITGGADSECAAKAVQYNQLQRDAANTQRELDNCNPAGARQRKIQEINQSTDAFIWKSRLEVQAASDEFTRQIASGNKLAAAARQLQKTLWDLEKQLDSVNKKNTDLEQYERRERRMFLDGSPQEAIGGIPGVRTTDDKVLLAFWVAYGAFIVGAVLMLMNIYAPAITGGKKAQAASVALLLGYLLAYYAISIYA